MYQPRNPYTRIAFATIGHYLKEGNVLRLQFKDLPAALYKKRGCFVSLHKTNDELRGCIGTIEPQEKTLAEEIKRNALSAAFHDRRFPPLTPDEFDHIKISVDVLTEPERIITADDLDPSIYGLIISDGLYRKGVLLPSIPGIDSVKKQIEIVKKKADLTQTDESKLFFYRFTSTRYD